MRGLRGQNFRKGTGGFLGGGGSSKGVLFGAVTLLLVIIVCLNLLLPSIYSCNQAGSPR